MLGLHLAVGALMRVHNAGTVQQVFEWVAKEEVQIDESLNWRPHIHTIS